MPRLTGPDGKLLSADAFRSLLRNEATLILQARGLQPPKAYGPKCARKGRRRGRRSRAQQAQAEKPSFQAADGMTCLYVVGCHGHPVKIGLTQNLDKRIAALQTGFPHRLHPYLLVQVPSDKARSAERACHDKLKASRLSGEWFNVTPEQAVVVVQDVAEIFNP